MARPRSAIRTAIADDIADGYVTRDAARARLWER